MKTACTLIILGELLLCYLVCLQGTKQTVQDCCLQTSDKRIPYGAIIGYEIQARNKGCPIDAVLFLTYPSRKLCATPGLPWVKKWIKKLDKRNKETEKNEKKTRKSEKI
ncbi:positive regulation of dendritic cell dendrite assembly, partial [Pristimantis euphronides]